MALSRPVSEVSFGGRRLAVATLLGLSFVAACSTSSTSAPVTSTPATSAPSGTAESPELPSDTSPASATAPPTSTTTEPPGPPVDCEADGGDGAAAEPAAPSGDSTDVVEIGTVDGVVVSAGLYPLPHDRGDPWSQWGQGVVLASGRFVSAVGDHLGVDGNSWFYEYDPTTGQLTRTADVSEALEHRSGDWGYGKVHAQMALGACGEVVAATYWGTRDDLVVGGSYQGDHLVRYDPATAELTSLGVPVAGFGIPSLAISPDGRYVFGEAVDPESQPDAGAFFAADALTGEVVFRSDDDRHVGFRSMLVDAGGAVHFSGGDGRLLRYEPGADDVTVVQDRLPGEWLRAASGVAPGGSVFGVSRRPDRLIEITAHGEIVDMGAVEGYVTSIALSPDGGTLYYVPDAHGESWLNGTPLIAVDTATGVHDVLVELNPIIEPALGVRVGGTYNVAVDPQSGRIYVGLNASEVGSDDLEATFGSVVLAVVDPGPSSATTTPSSTATTGSPRAVPEAGVCWTSGPADGSEFGFAESTGAFGLIEPLTGMYGHAVAAGDVNGDGWTDLFVAGFADRPSEQYEVRGATGPSPDRLLLGGEDGFTIDPTFPGQLARTSGATMADLDGDGDLDVVAVRNARERSDDPDTSASTVVYEQIDGGWRVGEPLLDGVAGRSVAVLDVDRDGLLDLLVVADRFGGGSTRLLRNDGDLRFTDVTADWGIPDDVTGLALATVDLDLDGWSDVVVSGEPRVLMGGPDGFRVEVHTELGFELFGDEDDPAGVAVGDLNGDGRPDLVVGQHFNSTVDDGTQVPVRIFVNREVDGGFALDDVTDAAGSPGLETRSPHVGIVDLDNDGTPDIVTSAISSSGAPILLRGLGSDPNGTPRFETVGRPGDGSYMVTGVEEDLDRDGRVDVFQVAWEPSDPSQLFTNTSASGHWVEIDLSGLPGGPDGARVDVFDAETETVLGRGWGASTTGYAAGPTSVVHLGLGDAEPDELTVRVVPPGESEDVLSFPASLDSRVAVGGC